MEKIISSFFIQNFIGFALWHGHVVCATVCGRFGFCRTTRRNCRALQDKRNAKMAKEKIVFRALSRALERGKGRSKHKMTIRCYSTTTTGPFKKYVEKKLQVPFSHPVKKSTQGKFKASPSTSTSKSPQSKPRSSVTSSFSSPSPPSSSSSSSSALASPAPKRVFNFKLVEFFKKKENELLMKLSADSQTLNPTDIEYTPIPSPVPTQVATLEHNLDRVLFSPGVHFLQDPRTRVFNFTPFLKKIMPVSKFDFNCLTQYITASKDKTLLQIAKESDLKYYSSTSSMTSALTQFHFWLSNNRPANIINLSKNFNGLGTSFSTGTKCATALMCKNQDGLFSIDADKSADRELLLSLLGHSMEKLLTTSPELFNKYHIDNSHQLTAEELDKSESYHYAKVGDFLMRSQLDCYDHRLPGTGTFDLKTRAVCAVRHDISHTEKHMTGYKIFKNHGLYESFEREFFELTRSALLKYSLQARIGNMDGIFICYHNIQNIFGFQYLGLEDIDHIFHSYDDRLSYKDFNRAGPNSKLNAQKVQAPIGSEVDDSSLSSYIADQEFRMSVKIWSEVLNKINQKLDNSSFRLVIKYEPEDSSLYCIATPMTNERIDEVQMLGDKSNSKFLDEDHQGNDEADIKFKQLQREKFQAITEETAGAAIGYKLTRKHFFDDKESNEVYYKPPINTKWEIKYQIEEIVGSKAVELYKKYMGEKENISWMDKGDDLSEQIDEYVKILRAYGDKGKLREELWKEKDEKLTIWEPIRNDRTV